MWATLGTLYMNPSKGVWYIACFMGKQYIAYFTSCLLVCCIINYSGVMWVCTCDGIWVEMMTSQIKGNWYFKQTYFKQSGQALSKSQLWFVQLAELVKR
jgi:hypothetical protein